MLQKKKKPDCNSLFIEYEWEKKATTTKPDYMPVNSVCTLHKVA